MKPQIVFASYKPHAGREAELKKLIARHLPTLRKLELVTDRAPILVKAKDGTYIEIFEWVSPEAAGKAHEHPAVAEIWEAMGKSAAFVPLGKLEETRGTFPHFTPVDV